MKISNFIPVGLTKYSPKTLTEAETNIERFAHKLSLMTDQNQHTEVIVELAKFVGDKKWIDIAQAIQTIHNAEGSIPLELLKYRNEIAKRLLNAVGHKMGTAVKNQIADAL